jgi:hypothetical protein
VKLLIGAIIKGGLFFLDKHWLEKAKANGLATTTQKKNAPIR